MKTVLRTALLRATARSSVNAAVARISLDAALLCATALIGVNAAHAQDRTERSSMKQTLHFAGAGTHTLELRAITGTIRVEAYDGHDVEMVVDRSVIADTEEALRDADREVILNTSDNAATVGAVVRERYQGACGEQSHDGSWYRPEPRYEVRFDFTVRVPADTRLQLCAINGGEVTVKGTRAEFSVRNVNGPITMTDIGGSGDAFTVNGPVHVSFVSTPQAASQFKTINGDVVLSSPDGLAADLRMKTFHGGLYTDFDVRTLPVETLHPVEKRGGMSVYRTNGFTVVRVGNGGPGLTLQTLNGDVRVLRRSK
jgi:hypothetical protein